MTARHPLLGALLLLTLPACQATPDISGVLDDYAEHANSVLVLTCQCPEELGHETIAECTDAVGEVGPDERACLTDVSEGYEAEVESYLECALPALEAYDDCLFANTSCGEGLYEVCVKAYQDAEEQCSPLPEAIRVSFAVCTNI